MLAGMRHGRPRERSLFTHDVSYITYIVTGQAQSLSAGHPASWLLRLKSREFASPEIEAGMVEHAEPGLDLHLDLGVRGADDHAADRTVPAPSSPDPGPRDGLRKDATLNLRRDGLLAGFHRAQSLVAVIRPAYWALGQPVQVPRWTALSACLPPPQADRDFER